jgi:hypothetical protein
VFVLIGTYIVVLIGGTFLYNPSYGGASVSLFVSDSESYAMITQVLWLLCAFAVGASLFTSRAPGHRRRNVRKWSGARSGQLPNVQAAGALLLALCSLALVLAGTGWENVYFRTGYMVETNHFAKVIGYAMLPVGIIALGAASTNRNALYRSMAGFLAVASLCLTLALNTRVFCLIPALFFGGALMIQSTRKRLRIALIASIIAAPALVTIPLTGRGMTRQGIVAVPDLAYELSQIDVATNMHEILNNLFVSAPITTQSMRAKVNNSLDYILVAINPLPGFMTEWHSSQRKINRATPFNAVGDLLRGGELVATCYFALLGLYFAWIDRKIRSTPRPPLPLFATVALSYIFIIMTLQYPLRNCTRLVYYMAAIDTFVWLRARGRKQMVVERQASPTSRIATLRGDAWPSVRNATPRYPKTIDGNI